MNVNCTIMTSLRSILIVQLFLDLVIPVLHIVVACTRFNDDHDSVPVMFTILLIVVSWLLTNGISWVLLLRHRRGTNASSPQDDSGLDWTGLACHLLQLGPLWRFAKALSGSASSQFANLILLHLVPVFLQDLPLSVLDVYLMLSARKEFFILTLSASASVLSAALILSSYREEVIRLTRKRKPSSHETTDTSQDGGLKGNMVDFPALGIFSREVEKQLENTDNERRGSCAHSSENAGSKSIKPSAEAQNVDKCSKLALDAIVEETNPPTEQKSPHESKNSARHWTRFVWMTSLLVSRVVSLASFAAVKPWMIFLLAATQWIIAFAGLRIQTYVQHRLTRDQDCSDRFRDVATSYAYVFCFLNLKPGHALAMSAFYHTIILTENVGLVAVFLWNFNGENVYMVAVTSVAFSSFLVAILLIVVFYCVFSERAYLLVIEKCACCIWWNSERKRRAEEKVARKAARMEAKKVMTQCGTQINTMATHIITTLSLLPKGPQDQGDKASLETKSVPVIALEKLPPEWDLALSQSRPLRSQAIAAISHDESRPQNVSFSVDAFGETPSDKMRQEHPASSPPVLSEDSSGELSFPVTTENNHLPLPPPLFLLTPPTVSSRFRREEGGRSNAGFSAEVTAEVHAEQRPPGGATTMLPTPPETAPIGSWTLASSAEPVTLEAAEAFGEILLDENLDICESWKQSCLE